MNSMLDKGLIAGGRERRKVEDRQFSSHRSILFGENSDEEALTVPRKVHYHSFWKHIQDAVYWVKLSPTQDQGLQFWKTKSNAVVVNDHVPADCIYRVTSQSGEQIQCERVPTPRPAPKMILKSRWRIEQEQYCESASSDAWRDWRVPRRQNKKQR